ncbi:hypothetical protein BD413DRAFT_137178 [Trametes elegans]|nr:hypothetical protein BD413DRAFT_137178 [Trametes elegans]
MRRSMFALAALLPHIFRFYTSSTCPLHSSVSCPCLLMNWSSSEHHSTYWLCPSALHLRFLLCCTMHALASKTILAACGARTLARRCMERRCVTSFCNHCAANMLPSLPLSVHLLRVSAMETAWGWHSALAVPSFVPHAPATRMGNRRMLPSPSTLVCCTIILRVHDPVFSSDLQASGHRHSAV